MTAVRRADRQGEWWIDFRYRSRRVRRLSPVQTKRGAEQMERQVRAELSEDEAHGRNPFAGPPPKFAEFAERWMREYVATTNRPSSSYSKVIAMRTHLVPTFGHLRLDEITTATADAFSARLKCAGTAPKTICNLLSMLRASLVTANEWGLLRAIPRIRRLSVPDPAYRYLTVDESRRLLAAAEGKWRAFILFLLHTGLRFSEAAALKPEDLDFDRSCPYVRVWKGGHRGVPGPTKSGRLREVPLTPEVVQALSEHSADGELLFPRSDGGMMSPASAAKYLYRICDHAGIKRHGWHVLRHTFATRLGATGVAVHVLKELLGHSSIKMTLRYMHVERESVESTVALIRRAIPGPVAEHFGHQMATKAEIAVRNRSSELQREPLFPAEPSKKPTYAVGVHSWSG